MTFTGAPVAGVASDHRLPGASRSRLSPTTRTVFLILALSVGIADLVVLDTVVLPRTLARKARPAPAVPAPAVPAPVMSAPAVPLPIAPVLAVPASSVAAAPSPALVAAPPVPVPPEIPVPAQPVAAPPEAVPDLLFWRNAAVLTRNDWSILKNVLATLTARPDLRVHVGGHTDDLGPERVNSRLSLQRAQAVQKWLVRRGVDSSRIEAEGFGSSKPRGGAVVPAARPQNRRVEIEIR
jgi:outer membrane protein OmpA-like peptidoglycan-associated protein